MRTHSLPNMARKLAIVDPDPTNCMLLREIGIASGWDVTGFADSVAEGLALVARVRPDCLIADYHFGGGHLGGDQTGLDLIARAKCMAPGLFGVILTGWDINEVSAHISAMPPDRILRKPVPPHFLMNLLDSISVQQPEIRINAI